MNVFIISHNLTSAETEMAFHIWKFYQTVLFFKRGGPKWAIFGCLAHALIWESADLNKHIPRMKGCH